MRCVRCERDISGMTSWGIKGKWHCDPCIHIAQGEENQRWRAEQEALAEEERKARAWYERAARSYDAYIAARNRAKDLLETYHAEVTREYGKSRVPLLWEELDRMRGKE